MSLEVSWQKADGSDGIDIAAAGDGVAEFRLNGSPLAQPMPKLRAETRRYKGRGGLTNRVSFTVTYAATDTVEEAIELIATKSAALQPSLLTHELLVGVFGSFNWQLQDAAMEPFEFWHVGVTVYCRYAFVGGAFAEAPPPGP